MEYNLKISSSCAETRALALQPLLMCVLKAEWRPTALVIDSHGALARVSQDHRASAANPESILSVKPRINAAI